jgi:hypothetical protein
VKRLLILYLLFFVGLTTKPQVHEPQPISSYTYTLVSPTDSTLSYRSLSSYDENGNLILSASYDWNSYKNKWEGVYKDECFWDEAGNQIISRHSFWNYDLNSWRLEYKHEYSWDSNKNKTSETSYYWNTNLNEWIGSYKFEYSYDAKGNVVLEVHSDWYCGGTGWTIALKEEIFYDANDNKTLVKVFCWNGGDSFYSKSEYSYDANGKQILEVVSYCSNPEANDWILFSRTGNIYDSIGHLISEIRLEWPTIYLLGRGTYKAEYSYDVNGNMILSFLYNLDKNTNVWILKDKEEYTYDASGRQTLLINYDWDSATNVWVISVKDEDAYDNQGNKILSIWTYWDSGTHELIFSSKEETFFNVNGKKISEAYYNRQDISNYWNLVSKTYYSYKPSLIINSESEIKVFPNPFRDMLYIGLPEEPEYTLFELYDSAGRKIITSKEKVIDLSFLAQGVYMIRVIDKNGSLIKTMKVVKE